MHIKIKEAVDYLDRVNQTTNVYYYVETGKYKILDWNSDFFREEEDEFECEDEEVVGKRIPLPDYRDINGYDMMAEFAQNVTDNRTQEALYRSLNGKGAFRHFKDTLHYTGLIEAWYKFRDDKFERLIRRWCRDNDLKIEGDVSDIISLRPLEMSDAETLAKICNNEKLQKYLLGTIPFPYTVEDAKWFINHSNSDHDNFINFGITANGVLIGNISAERGPGKLRHTAELGYYISDEYRGKGYTPEAVKQMLKYVFENTDINRIYAESFSPNKASQRVLEKCGFTHEAIFRESGFIDGEFVDGECYAILRDEYLED